MHAEAPSLVAGGGDDASGTAPSHDPRHAPQLRRIQQLDGGAERIQVDMPHALGGTAPVVASPMRFSETPVEYRISPPLLGQYNEEIYQGLLGKSAEELQKLKAAGIV